MPIGIKNQCLSEKNAAIAELSKFSATVKEHLTQHGESVEFKPS